jgi:hypothetical protein
MRRGSDKEFADEAAIGTGLFGHEHIAEHGFGFIENVLGGFAEVHATFETVLESAFAPAAGVNLRFDDDELFAPGEELVGDGFGLLGRGANVACGHSDAALGEKLFGLVFVEIQRELNKVNGLNELH